jgi:TDG/mug DNA glycosylase family protein
LDEPYEFPEGLVLRTVLPRLRHLPDRIQPGLRALFVGINPGIRSAAIGHHFAGYSNRFWKLLYESGLVPDPITCEQDIRLPEWGYGLTNVIARPTRGIDELTADEYAIGRRRLTAKIRRVRPDVVVLVGMTLATVLRPPARMAGKPGSVRVGRQPWDVSGVPVFILPNPSGRNAHFSHADMLTAFRGLKRYLDRLGAPCPGR